MISIQAKTIYLMQTFEITQVRFTSQNLSHCKMTPLCNFLSVRGLIERFCGSLRRVFASVCVLGDRCSSLDTGSGAEAAEAEVEGNNRQTTDNLSFC